MKNFATLYKMKLQKCNIEQICNAEYVCQKFKAYPRNVANINQTGEFRNK